jgi:hypothetical protein
MVNPISRLLYGEVFFHLSKVFLEPVQETVIFIFNDPFK